MAHILHIECDGTETDCYKDGVPCRHVRTSHFGGRWHCQIFDLELRDQNGVLSGPGRLQRLPECLGATVVRYSDAARYDCCDCAHGNTNINDPPCGVCVLGGGHDVAPLHFKRKGES